MNITIISTKADLEYFIKIKSNCYQQTPQYSCTTYSCLFLLFSLSMVEGN